MQDIVLAFEEALEAGKQTALATVVQVQGSSYRRPGARMLVTEDGQLTGAISGGCLEGDALRKARLVMHQQKAMLVTYDTTDDDGIASAPPITRQVGSAPLTIDVEETEDVSASPIPESQVRATGSTTHTWVAEAADLTVGVTLDQAGSSESRVGTRVPFTARVTSGDNLLQGWDVAFAVDGESVGTAVTDANGEAVFRATRTTESPIGRPP